MNELARLGISMDTKPLRDGKAALDAIVPSAQKAEKGIEAFNAAAAGMKPAATTAGSGMASFGAAINGVTASTDRLSKAALGNSTAMRTVQAAAAGASAPIGNLVGNITRVSIATGQADAHIKAYRASLASIPAAANGAASSLSRLGSAANDNINALQSTPGNIAAQFQDIGVTAAGGMSPLLIALQQGTQLSSAMQGGVGNLVAGLRQLFNATTILTVGLVGLVAAGLQAIDWMRVAEVLLNGVADGLDALAGYVEAAAVGIVYFGLVATVAFAPKILAMVLSLATTIGATLYGMIGKATVAMIVFASANPFGAVVIAIGLVITAMSLLNDKFGGVFTNILTIVRSVANGIIRFFAGAFNVVLSAAEKVVNGIISAFEGVAGFLGFDVSVGRVDLSGAKIDTTAGRDFVGEIGSFIGGAISRGAELARGLIPSGAAAEGGSSRAAGGTRQTEAQRQAEAYDTLIARAEARVASLNDEAAALGMTEMAAQMYLNRQGLLADAAQQNIALDDARRAGIERVAQAMTNAQMDVEVAKATRAYNEQSDALQRQADLIGLTGFELEYAANRQEMMNDAVQSGAIEQARLNGTLAEFLSLIDSRAATLANQAEDNREADFTSDFTRNLELQQAALERSRAEIGLTGAALTAYRIESDLLNRAARENIELTPEYIDSIRQQAQQFGAINEQIRLQRERFDDAREGLRGFFGDMVSGLQQGQSVWETFGNAVMSIVNRIISRLLDNGVDSLLGSLGQLFGGASASMQRALAPGVNNMIAANPGLFAKGGAFDGGVQMFAKGGAFTNGVYNDPTVFKFAKGGAFGVMGEAGPEAVMPLKRGSDGSLGVRVTAAEPQTVMVRVTTDDPRFNAYVDDRIGQSAPTVAQAGARISQSETAFNNTRRLA